MGNRDWKQSVGGGKEKSSLGFLAIRRRQTSTAEAFPDSTQAAVSFRLRSSVRVQCFRDTSNLPGFDLHAQAPMAELSAMASSSRRHRSPLPSRRSSAWGCLGSEPFKVAEGVDLEKNGSMQGVFSAAPLLGVGTMCYPLVEKTVLGSMLTVRCSSPFDKNFYGYCLERVDTSDRDTLRFHFRDGEIREIGRSDVEHIMGVKSGSRKIKLGTPKDKGRKIEKVQKLLKLRVNGKRGISVSDLKRTLQICDAYGLNKETYGPAMAAYALLSCCTLVSPRPPNANVPDELLACVANPAEICEYDWAGYILDVLRASAEKYQEELSKGVTAFTPGGSHLFIQVCEKMVCNYYYFVRGSVFFVLIV